MNGDSMRPVAWLAAALGAQAAGVAVLAALQVAAFVSPPSLGEATAVGIGYVVLLVASAATCLLGAVGAFSAVHRLGTWRAAVLVVMAAAPLVFVGVAEFYATLAMLAVF
ncbi:MAG: hypothetical protein IPF53_12225 [Blastocatellia bacterium]|nr:hypothetical protein [Blastocatellia bacterium]